MGYWVVKIILTPILYLAYRVRTEGRDNVPTSGAVILAANHRSFMDSIFLPSVISRRVTFVAKAEYFDDPKTAWFFRAVGQIPIRRGGGSESERALASAADVLDDHGVFAIYPEGTRTRDGLLHRGHTGVARLALRTGAPIVPVGLIGTDEVQPTDARLPRCFRSITIRFGTPLETTHMAGRQDDPLALRQVTDELMYEIHTLSGYDYVDTYATKAKSAERGAEVPEVAGRVATLAS